MSPNTQLKVEALDKARSERARKLAPRLLERVGRALQGKSQVVERAVACVIAGGHLLVEDVPGVGKTTLARALARCVGARFARVQFTSDLLPADVLGVNVFNQNEGRFEFRAGPIFANLVLADEINRTTPRTQSALLEAMSEGRVSIDDVTHVLPRPFLVIATQNPLEAHGTYPLPESQLDRFLMRLAIGYPDSAVERQLLVERRRDEPVDAMEAVLSLEELLDLQAAADAVHVDESLVDYALEIVQSTRRSPRLAVGVSPRGALSLLRAVRGLALTRGRDYAVPDDIRELAPAVLAHRVSLAGLEGALGDARRVAESIVEELVSGVEPPV